MITTEKLINNKKTVAMYLWKEKEVEGTLTIKSR